MLELLIVSVLHQVPKALVSTVRSSTRIRAGVGGRGGGPGARRISIPLLNHIFSLAFISLSS